jgi:hypothetical protein
MTCARGTLGLFPGRLTVRVLLPDDLRDKADRLASGVGVDRAIVLGDLVASVLPSALAEAARDVLGDTPEAARPADIPPACQGELSQNARNSVAADWPEIEVGPGDTD